MRSSGSKNETAHHQYGKSLPRSNTIWGYPTRPIVPAGHEPWRVRAPQSYRRRSSPERARIGFSFSSPNRNKRRGVLTDRDDAIAGVAAAFSAGSGFVRIGTTRILRYAY